jgi:fructose-1,6-bisphosphatase I
MEKKKISWQEGRRQVAAGYALYGPQTIFTLSVGSGVSMFTLDPASKQFVLTKSRSKNP